MLLYPVLSLGLISAALLAVPFTFGRLSLRLRIIVISEDPKMVNCETERVLAVGCIQLIFKMVEQDCSKCAVLLTMYLL
ncbi:hypothetical protein JAAARDRAFT_37364 [Jaapia argillacea MUCL 33604]|uniref:Uncharacterized protein n=1 Tax=Jaapia argillacea MUCL 33604 TaxID=933084 RepID=A0A067PNH0_9AGAM|nr:hypothetical protein JAAARDRAFT_37364 [Jaapia argillacea MUCL 33604]